MTMTREPLMLSDTAMVLLRQSIEVQEFISTLHEAFHAEMQRLSYPPRSMRYIQTWNSWRDSDAYRLRAQIYEKPFDNAERNRVFRRNAIYCAPSKDQIGFYEQDNCSKTA